MAGGYTRLLLGDRQTKAQWLSRGSLLLSLASWAQRFASRPGVRAWLGSPRGARRRKRLQAVARAHSGSFERTREKGQRRAPLYAAARRGRRLQASCSAAAWSKKRAGEGRRGARANAVSLVMVGGQRGRPIRARAAAPPVRARRRRRRQSRRCRRSWTAARAATK
ncbi:MAG: hypothetical protein J3K34DRAFT_419216 [Monoraphidium minutum]|nr:MAG: hypothetical protein J3K34DRAFT_419216 [Monoraphidium minutum]